MSLAVGAITVTSCGVFHVVVLECASQQCAVCGGQGGPALLILVVEVPLRVDRAGSDAAGGRPLIR